MAAQIARLGDRPAWKALGEHSRHIKGKHLRELFAMDAARGIDIGHIRTVGHGSPLTMGSPCLHPTTSAPPSRATAHSEFARALDVYAQAVALAAQLPKGSPAFRSLASGSNSQISVSPPRPRVR